MKERGEMAARLVSIRFEEVKKMSLRAGPSLSLGINSAISKVILGLVLILLLGIFSFAQGKGETLRFKFLKGEKVNYRLTISGGGKAGLDPTLLSFKLEIDLLVGTEVLDVSPEGVVDLKIIPKDIEIYAKPLGIITVPPEFKKTSFVVKISPRGKTVGGSGLEKFSMNTDAEVFLRLIAESMIYFNLVLPEGKAEVGDKWEEVIVKAPHQPVEVKYTFEGYKKEKGVDCVVIKSSKMSFPFTTLGLVSSGDYNPLRGKVTTTLAEYFDKDKGVLVKLFSPISFEMYGIITRQIQNEVNVKILKMYFEGEADLERVE